MTDVLDASNSPAPSDCESEWVHINSASNDCYGSSRVPSPSIRSVSSTCSREPSDQDAAFSNTPDFNPKKLSGLQPSFLLPPWVNAVRPRASKDNVNRSLFPHESNSGTDSVTGGATSQEHGQNYSTLEPREFLVRVEEALEVLKNTGISRTPPPTAPTAAGGGQSKEGQKASTEVHSDAAESLSGRLGRIVDEHWPDGFEGPLPEPDGTP